MLSKSEKAKLFSFIVATLALTAVIVGIVVCKKPSSTLSFALGGVTALTWSTLVELIGIYLEEGRKK